MIIFVPLTPALSRGRGRIVRCLSAVPATEFAKPSQGTFEKFLLAFASIDAP